VSSRLAASRLGRHLPILEGVAPYRTAWLSQDVLAGITLAALAIPEVMGYTRIAGMPVITGLYTMLIPVIAFAVFGSSRHLVVGGDSATAAIMFAGLAGLGTAGLRPDTPQWVGLAGLSALIAAAMLFVARVARLGFLADFLSRTVLVGFLTGVGVQVAIGQLGGMLGVPAPHVAANAFSGAVRTFALTLAHIRAGSWQTAAVSAATLLVLVCFRRLVRAVPAGLVAVVGMIAVSWIFDFAGHDIAILGPVPSGLPHIGRPEHVGWGDVPKLLGLSASMFLVILAQSAATSRAYAVKYTERVNVNTDLIGLGLANVAAGLSSTFVVNGSPTKTEMVDEARSRTQVAQLATAAVVALVLLFLTRPLRYLPDAVLSAVVFLIGLKLIDISRMREIWRLRKDEFVVAALTTVCVVVVGVEQGIILAIVLSLVLHVRRHYDTVDLVIAWDASGRIRMMQPTRGTETVPGLVVYRFGAGLFYANAARLEQEVLVLVSGDPPPRWLVLDAIAVDDVDYTAGKTLLELADQLHARGIVFAVADASDRVRDQLDRYGLIAKIGTEHVLDGGLEALEAFRARTPS
jgi:SulP family sulfate permease